MPLPVYTSPTAPVSPTAASTTAPGPPSSGDLPLTQIDRGAISRRINERSAAKSDKTIRNEYEAADMQFLTHAEYARLREHYRPLFLTLVGTGRALG